MQVPQSCQKNLHSLSWKLQSYRSTNCNVCVHCSLHCVLLLQQASACQTYVLAIWVSFAVGLGGILVQNQPLWFREWREDKCCNLEVKIWNQKSLKFHASLCMFLDYGHRILLHEEYIIIVGQQWSICRVVCVCVWHYVFSSPRFCFFQKRKLNLTQSPLYGLC